MKPFETSDVLSALIALRQASPLPMDHPLVALVSDPGAGLTSQAFTEYLIYQMLSAIIRHQLHSQRAAYGLDDKAIRGRTIRDLQRDYQANNVEREAWSLLYYRYVRIELDLSVEQIACHVSQTVRTLQRRQQVGLVRLTHQLFRREQQLGHRWQRSIEQKYLPVSATAFSSGLQINLTRASQQEFSSPCNNETSNSVACIYCQTLTSDTAQARYNSSISSPG